MTALLCIECSQLIRSGVITHTEAEAAAKQGIVVTGGRSLCDSHSFHTAPAMDWTEEQVLTIRRGLVANMGFPLDPDRRAA